MGDYESLRQIVEDLLRVFGIEPKENTLAYLGLGVFAVLILIIFVLRPIIKNHSWRKKQLDKILKGYERYSTLWQHRLYIKIYFQEKPSSFCSTTFRRTN